MAKGLLVGLSLRIAHQPRWEVAMTIRAPAVAGSFYPDDAAELSGMVDRLLAEAARPPVPFPVVAVIAPHAGYGYSGPVAASAFASLRRAGLAARRVVVIGPSHHLAFR